MKFQMAENSLFAILLRSPWWASFGIFVALALLAALLLPAAYRLVGALGGLPFLVISVMAARRQWRLPSPAQVSQTQEALAAMTWPAFSGQLEEAFRRQGYAVQRGTAASVDFELERNGRHTLVCARRWKSARTGLEALRALQSARKAADATDAIYIGLGGLTENAQRFATEHRITVWQPVDLAQALHGAARG